MKKISLFLFIILLCFGFMKHLQWKKEFQLTPETLKTHHYVKLDEVPDTFKKTIVATEDERFYSHMGIDPIGILRVFYRAALNGGFTEGGSTITQQVVKNTFLTQEKTAKRKLKEIPIAIYIDGRYSKDDILEYYLNLIYFGEGAYGIKDAAKTFFGKNVEDLSLDEIALLAGMPQAPSAYSPKEHMDKALERRNIVLGIMKKENIITTEQYNKLKKKPIVLK